MNEQQKIELANFVIEDIGESFLFETRNTAYLFADRLLEKIKELEHSEQPTCLDKNGKLFFVGDVLKNEKSTATVEILQIEPDRIIYGGGNYLADGGYIDKQDFIDAGWIVHEPITEFKVEGINDEVENCVTQCNFMPAKIGSLDCADCEFHKGYNEDQQWIICELYNKEK